MVPCSQAALQRGFIEAESEGEIWSLLQLTRILPFISARSGFWPMTSLYQSLSVYY